MIKTRKVEARGSGSRALIATVKFLPMLLVALLSAQSVHAQTLKALHSFAGGSDGSGPNGALIRDSAGNLYGTTSGGGTLYEGTVFRVSASGRGDGVVDLQWH